MTTTAPALEVIEKETRPKDAPPRAALYGRTSTPKQRTADEQIRECRQRCAERGWQAKYALKDEGMKGDDETRPGFQRLMDLAERGAIDLILVWRVDRLARSLAHIVARKLRRP